jgi:hypothetical protein
VNAEQRLDRDLPLILGNLAAGPYPDYIDDVLATTAQRRQRSAWTFPERWLPVEIATRPVPTPAFPWRQLGVLALIAALLAVALAAYIGSQPRLPEPFGLAANGAVAYSVAGDIYTADPATGVVTPLVTGPMVDLRPQFSRDGSMLAFERKADADDSRSDVYVVRADGSGLTRVTAEAVGLPRRVAEVTPEDFEFSADGRSLLIPAGGSLLIAEADGSGVREVSFGSLGMMAHESSFRPPDGSEILFVGSDGINANGGAGIYTVDPAGGAIHTIVEPRAGNELAMATWSPDGSRISYTAWDPTASEFTAQVHVVAADGTDDRVLPSPPDSFWQGDSFWSNDGSRLFIIRGYSDGYGSAVGAVVPADGSSTGVEVEYDGDINGACCAVWTWAPDDSAIIGTPLDRRGRQTGQIIIDPDTGTAGPTRWTSSNDPTWQRVAP